MLLSTSSSLSASISASMLSSSYYFASVYGMCVRVVNSCDRVDSARSACELSLVALCVVGEQVWMRGEIGDSLLTSYLLLWTHAYPLRLLIRYLQRSCRRHARSDEGTVRHVITLHALQALLVGTFMTGLALYTVTVEGLNHTASVCTNCLT